MNKPIEGIHHIAMKVEQFDEVVSFYTDGLGFQIAKTWGEGESRAVLIDIGNKNYLEIFAGGKKSPCQEGSYIHIAFRSFDCDKDIQKAEKAGAVITMQPTDTTIPSEQPLKVRIAFCKGLNGEIIEFFEERD